MPQQAHSTGLKVVDFGHYIAGPLLAMLLADAGAEVVHVDPPGGPRWDDPANAVLQRGKRSVELDLKAADGRDVSARAGREADVLVENFRPGVMDRLGLGYDAMQRREPPPRLLLDPRVQRGRSALVDAGVGRHRVGGDVDLPATSTLRSRRPHHRHRPVVHAPRRCCRPTRRRSLRTPSSPRCSLAIAPGEGQRVEVSLFDAAYEVFGHELQMAHNMASGAFKPPPRPGLGHYKCKDGRWLHLCLFEDRHMRWFAQEFVPEWLDEGVAEPDRLRAEPELQVELIKRFTELFSTRDAAEWEVDINERTGAPCAVCQTTDEWLRVDEGGRDSHAVADVVDPVLGLDRTARAARRAEPHAALAASARDRRRRRRSRLRAADAAADWRGRGPARRRARRRLHARARRPDRWSRARRVRRRRDQGQQDRRRRDPVAHVDQRRQALDAARPEGRRRPRGHQPACSRTPTS